jgi:hypothetical protein
VWRPSARLSGGLSMLPAAQQGYFRCTARVDGRNPKGCQKVAGGRSEAKTPGTGQGQRRSTPQGCQNRVRAANGSGIPPGCVLWATPVPGVSLADSLDPRLPSGTPPAFKEGKAPARPGSRSRCRAARASGFAKASPDRSCPCVPRPSRPWKAIAGPRWPCDAWARRPCHGLTPPQRNRLAAAGPRRGGGQP